MQNNTFSRAVKWQMGRPSWGMYGWLAAKGRVATTPAEWQSAFPSHEVDYKALRNPPSAAQVTTPVLRGENNKQDMCKYMRGGRVDIFNVDTICKVCKMIMEIR